MYLAKKILIINTWRMYYPNCFLKIFPLQIHVLKKYYSRKEVKPIAFLQRDQNFDCFLFKD
jgi:hypothetical protein